MRLLDTFMKFDAEGFFKDKKLAYLRCYDAYEKKLNKETGYKEKTDKKLGVWVELSIISDNTKYEILDSETGEKRIEESQNFNEKFMALVTNPSKSVEDFKSFSIGDPVKITGYQGEVIMGRFNDIYQPRVKDVVKIGDEQQTQQKRSE
ncbi:hypothetical protein [Staphylococcus warneri]|uniref:hypothetical protein n=1 Tax=Staphylococcus warneri TaxID=1292 RepID=UPI00167C282A|nr:hypothetical protein [Staphylococcus warneri]